MTDRRAAASEPIPPASERTVLIVDDEQDVRETLADYLQHGLPSIKILLAASGAEAMRLLERETIHVMITDFRMPRMDGLELLGKARARWPELPTLMMTAYPDVQLAAQALNEHRVSYFLVKPLDPDKVLDWVADSLWRRYLDEMRDFALKDALGLLGEMTGAAPTN